MAGKGRAPKPNAVRRNKEPFSHNLSDGPQKARELPKVLPIQTNAAKRFWKTWAESPQSEHFVETDWAELEVTTMLVDAFYLGDSKLASEIRIRVAKWGATTEDRARLRMNFDKSVEEEKAKEPETPAENVADMELYRKLGGT